MRLKDKVVLVSGGASGIGAETARLVLREGGKAVLADRDEAKGKALAAELGKAALFVPLEAVFKRDGRALVYVPTLGGPREREVSLGPSNQDFVVIEKGLKQGERVYLRDPLAPSSELTGPATP